MKTTDNSLLLKHTEKNSALSTTAKPSVGVRSARPMKSMVRVKSIKPQRIELKAGIRKRTIKL